MSLRLIKQMSIDDFINSKKFAEMHNLTRRQLAHRLHMRQVDPMPIKFGVSYIYDPDARIVVPKKQNNGGRPKGTTVANGAKSPKYHNINRVLRKIKKKK